MHKSLVRLMVAHPDHAEILANAIAVARSYDDSTLRNFSMFTRPLTVMEEKAYLIRMHSSLKVRFPKDNLFLIIRVEDGKLLGTTGLHEVDEHNHTARIGIMIFDPRERHRHYATEALDELLEFGFRRLELNKVYANVLVNNQDQIAWDEHYGFVEEGLLRKAYLLNGQYHDMIQLALLKSEWEVRRNKGKL